VIRDDAAERKLRRQLQQREDELQEARGRIKQLHQEQEGLVRNVQQLIELAQDARLKVPSQLLNPPHSRNRSRSGSRNGAGRRDSRDRYEKSSRRSSRSRSISRNGGGRRESRDRYRHSNKYSSRRSSRSRSRSSSRSRGDAAWRSHSSGDRAPGRAAPALRSQPPAIDPSLFNVARAPLAALHGGGGSDTETRSETPDGLVGHDGASDSEDGEVAEQGPSRGAAAAGGLAAAAGGVNGRAAASSRAGHGGKQGMVQPAGCGGIARAVDREGRDRDRSGLDRGYDSTDSGYRQHNSGRGQQPQQQRGSKREGRRDAYDDRGRGSDGVQYDRKSGRDSREGDQSRRYDAAGSRYCSSSGKGGQYRRS
jgi:hypothetical protein